MRILHLSSEKSWRGGEQQIAYLIEELGKLGVENHVACRLGSAFEAYCQKERIPYFSAEFSQAFNIATARKIARYTRRHGMGLVHMHSGKSHTIGVLSTLAGHDAPLVLSRRVDFPVKAHWFSQWKYNHRRIQRVVCVSEKIRQIMAQTVRPPEKCVTVHSGIDLHKFDAPGDPLYFRNRYSIAKGETIIGNTSALAPHKDYHTFIDTAAILMEKGVKARFLAIGSGPQKDQLMAYAKQKGVGDYVIFTGFIDHLPNVLKGLDLFLMTSKTEGLGTSILDAFACRIPVVATAAGGIPEMVAHGETGLLAPIQQAGTLAQNIMQLMADPGLQSKLTAGALQKLQGFSKQNTARKTLSIYREILGE